MSDIYCPQTDHDGCLVPVSRGLVTATDAGMVGDAQYLCDYCAEGAVARKIRAGFIVSGRTA